MDTHTDNHYHYAGFWRRTFALTIDYIIISVAAFPLILLLGFITPDSVTVSVPFKLFTSSEILSEQTQLTSAEQINDRKKIVRITEVTVLNHWKYLYQDVSTIITKGSQKIIRTESYQINPLTNNQIDNTTLDDLVIPILLLYLSFFESRSNQASIGKRALGLRVISRSGEPLTLIQSLGRNLLKIVSAMIFCIGFMMAGWTRYKQALHDKITNHFNHTTPHRPKS
jgi:uncharacterized RDD family membrane protein YckC